MIFSMMLKTSLFNKIQQKLDQIYIYQFFSGGNNSRIVFRYKCIFLIPLNSRVLTV